MTSTEALQTLHLAAPTTANAIKSSFRRLSKLEHPDFSKHPQAAERFRHVKEAYEALKQDPSVLDASVVIAESETVDGVKLLTLGLGLGPTTNGAMCGNCHGNGFTSIDLGGLRACPDCKSIDLFDKIFFHSRRRRVRCPKCSGTGVFSIKQGGKVVPKGRCFKCQGTGRYEGWCPTCGNKGFIPAKKGRDYFVCDECKGAGEIAMWNPVLPKGLIL